MNARQLETLRPEIEATATRIGVAITRLWPLGSGFGFAWRRIGRPAIWEETAPAFTSIHGRVDFTACHAACEEIEKREKKIIKQAMKHDLSACRVRKIVGIYEDHHDKLVMLADGVAFNQ